MADVSMGLSYPVGCGDAWGGVQVSAMPDRRSFLDAVSGVAASVLLVGAGEAQSPPPSPSPSSPPPSPVASASPKPPSAVAAALAASMLRFDAALGEKDLDAIARAIDENRR